MTKLLFMFNIYFMYYLAGSHYLNSRNHYIFKVFNYERIKQKNISGWGGYPVQKANMVYPKNIEQILIETKNGDSIARGNGRSYGDSSINAKYY